MRKSKPSKRAGATAKSLKKKVKAKAKEAKPKASEHTHHDIYFRDDKLYERLVKATDKLVAKGMRGKSISSVVCDALEIALPNIEGARFKSRDIQFVDDMANVRVVKVGRTYMVLVKNLPDDHKIQVGGDWFFKDKKGRTDKQYPRVIITREGNKHRIEQKGA